MEKGRREEATAEHSVEAIKESRGNKTKMKLVKLVREKIEARGLGGCSSLQGLLKALRGSSSAACCSGEREGRPSRKPRNRSVFGLKEDPGSINPEPIIIF
jgi:hypothetical protein